jgi:ADP-ribose pyrophosphatase YjhB (NUDIX family)
MKSSEIRNKKGEWWIPKGHIESWENELEACYREIKEEVNINKEDLNYVDFLENYKFTFLDENGKENTKEIFIYVFDANSKSEMNIENGGDDIKKAEWLELNDALDKIMPYSKSQLESAIKIYKNKLNI